MEPTTADTSLLDALKQYFGFSSFRPLQEEIIRDTLAGRDVFALLPTGGGKSLCYQLPAVLHSGLTVVISPLIALMKDQVDALQASGVAATALNSSLDATQARTRIRGLHQNEYRLLYIAPERLMLPGFLADLQRWDVRLFAIDEAHCISEWGHDFRPEYRQLVEVRERFPQVPFMALTATATERVRGDIVKQLKLRTPHCYVASFNRPNLTYRVWPKSSALSQLREFIKSRPEDSGIVYCQSRKSTEEVARELRASGIEAQPYHAGMEAQDRSRNQEQFLRDDVRVICATIAFGMGVNKPNVRFVVHHDLPKNIEGYYQETGRAGRDGLPSECVLLYSNADMMKQMHFIDEKENPAERANATQQLRQMVDYAESADCRRARLLRYFGEEYPQAECTGCDNCLSPRPTYDGTVDAQKFLSCIYRIREKSGFGVGFKHVIDVLVGADTEGVRKWGHETLSTYKIGGEHSRKEWDAIGRELVRLGLIAQNMDKFNVLELTAEGKTMLTQRKTVTLRKPAAAAEPDKRAHKEGEIECDEALFEKLRALRKRLADERGVPAYIIFYDTTLRQMAREYPVDDAELARIYGMGEKKRNEFGAIFLNEIAAFLRSSQRKQFAQLTEAPLPAEPKKMDHLRDTEHVSLRMFQEGKSPQEIAVQRGIVVNTVFDHLTAAVQFGAEVDLDRLIPPARQEAIKAALNRVGMGALKPVLESLGAGYDYGQLKIVRAAIKTGRIK